MIHPIEQIKEGIIVSENIYSASGQLIVPKNSILSRQMIAHLKFYGIKEVPVSEGPVPEEVKLAAQKQERLVNTHLQKLQATPEYQKFKKLYSESLSYTEESINDIVLRNAAIDEKSLISEAVALYNQGSSAFDLFGMLHSMKSIDDSTYSHSINVSLISRLIGTWLGYDEKTLDNLTLAGLLHDIGKSQIPNDIILKPGKLSKQEFEFIRMHPQFGYNIVKDKPIASQVKAAVLFHHERCDGSGYPFGYSGTQIQDFVSIISIADVYDAMTSTRCYRNALCPFDVIATFEQEGLNKYPAGILMTFLEKTANSYLNSQVLLNNGEIATIIYTNKKFTRPVVRLSNGSFFHLEDNPQIYIQAIV